MDKSTPPTREAYDERIRSLLPTASSYVFICRTGPQYTFVNFGEASEQVGLLAMFTEQKRGEIERLFTPARGDMTPNQQASGAV